MTVQTADEDRVAALERQVAYLLDIADHLERVTDVLAQEREQLQRQVDALADWTADIAAGLA